MAELLLEMKGIDKRFFGVHALKKVDFSLGRGEVRGLIGENGAGKSTLMKILGGEYQADEGEIILEGKKVRIRDEKMATEMGISFIHQELSLFPDLDLATNIFIQHLPSRGGIVVKRKEMKIRARKLLDEVGLSHCRLDQRLGSLQIGEQQLVEIARCLTTDIKLLVLDEPTSSLTSKEVKILFDLIRRMREKGVSVIFISHRLDELFEICDNISVMRDGEMVGMAEASKVTQKELIRMMLGRELNEMFDQKQSVPGDECLRVEHLTHAKRFNDVSFTVHKGEIVGLYGLLGSGRSEIARSVYGIEPFVSGDIYLEGKKVRFRNAGEAVKHGVCLVSEDRRKEGLCLDHSIQHNLSVASLFRLSRFFDYLDRRRETEMCRQNVADFRIATDRLGKAVKYLSGGNQQKVVIAKWMNVEPKVLLLDEPTRGVDVGAKKEIYALLNKMAQRGIAVLMISSELNEVMSTCDRVLVLRKGKIADEIPAAEMDKERLLAASMGGASA